jgi:hypothetical protein
MSTLLDADSGVMVTVRPVTSPDVAPVATLSVKVFVFTV